MSLSVYLHFLFLSLSSYYVFYVDLFRRCFNLLVFEKFLKFFDILLFSFCHLTGSLYFFLPHFLYGRVSVTLLVFYVFVHSKPVSRRYLFLSLFIICKIALSFLQQLKLFYTCHGLVLWTRIQFNCFDYKNVLKYITEFAIDHYWKYLTLLLRVFLLFLIVRATHFRIRIEKSNKCYKTSRFSK